MSPASQGALEVERYIGSCLISSNVRQGVQKTSIVGNKKQEPIRGKARSCYPTQNISYTNGGGNVEQCQVQYGPGNWAGTPLISMTSSPRKCNHRSSPSLGQQQQQQQVHQHACEQQQQTPSHQQKNSPLSRLAVHTQGAPLILAGRFHSRGKLPNNTCGNGNLTCGNQPAININGANHFQNNGNVVPPNTMARCPSSKSSRSIDTAKKPNNPKVDAPNNKEANAGTNIANIDSLSIASDESSNNSENSLPRIIKPRKRRKKDRKPTSNGAITVDGSKQDDQQQQQQPHQQPGNLPATEQTNMAAIKNYLPSSSYEQKYEFHVRNNRRPPIGIGRESVYGYKAPSSSSAHEIAVVRSQRYMHRHVPVKVLDDNRNVVLPGSRTLQQPKGYRASLHQHHRVNCANHHNNNNNNNVVRYSNNYSDSTCCEDNAKDCYVPCQTHYCNPPGQIWDVDQNSYSPFFNRSCHTSNNVYCGGRFSQMPIFLSQSALGCQEQFVDGLFEQVEEQQSRIQQKDIGGCGTILRRSWSDPTSYFSEEIFAPSKDVGVIGDRGQPETNKRRTLWRGDTLDASLNTVNGLTVTPANSPQSPPQGIEVSTEIVTSPNGHRDLEIKFYSPSPNAPAHEEEELADEGDDSSDIWSYHELKLQQDFRTLLQAEE